MENRIWDFLRYAMSIIMLWAFFDKLLGLGFATTVDKSWLNGVSPTAGFLKFGPDSFLAPFFNSLSGNVVVDILFMGGLLFVGLGLLLGIFLRLACLAGSLIMLLIYMSLFPPENNPIIDEHIVYILVLLGIYIKSEKQNFGLSKQWQKTSLVEKYPLFK